MKALYCRAFGPETDLTVEEIDTPVPAAGEVLVSVEAAGLNFPDLLCNSRCRDRDLLRKRTAQPVETDTIIDRHTRHIRAQCRHNTRTFAARYKRQRRLELVFPAYTQKIGEIKTRCLYRHQNFTSSRDRRVYLFNSKVGLRPECPAIQCFHDSTSNKPAAPIPPPIHMVQTTYLAPRRRPSIRA